LERSSKPVIIGDYAEILQIVKRVDVDRIVVALDERRGKFPIEQLLYCRLKGVPVEDGIAFTEQLAGNSQWRTFIPVFSSFRMGLGALTFLRK